MIGNISQLAEVARLRTGVSKIGDHEVRIRELDLAQREEFSKISKDSRSEAAKYTVKVGLITDSGARLISESESDLEALAAMSPDILGGIAKDIWVLSGLIPAEGAGGKP